MMVGRVALARKNLFQDRRRAVLSVLGVGSPLLLVLVLGGIFAGAMHRVTAYIRTSPADVFVSQKDVRTMHMSISALPPQVVGVVRTVDGVAWAEGLRYTTAVLETGDDRRITYVFGYDTGTARAGPERIVAGRAPGAGEIVVDQTAAAELGAGVGDDVVVLGRPFRVSGLSANGTNIVNTTVFVRNEDLAALRGPAYAYVLAGAELGVAADELARRIRDALPVTTVQTRSEFARQERGIVRDMAADVMAIMSTIGLLIALAVIAITLFTATLGKLREYGIVKALGAGRSRLAATVATQAAWSVSLALVVAVVLSIAVGAAVSALTPNVEVRVEAQAVLRTGIAALAIGAVAAVLPLRRIARVDPATAFRRP
jgi:putative ABC transport system permease protein